MAQPFNPDNPTTPPPWTPPEGSTFRWQGIDVPNLSDQLQSSIPVAEQLSRLFDNMLLFSEQFARNMQGATSQMQQQLKTYSDMNRTATTLTQTETKRANLGQRVRGAFQETGSMGPIRQILSGPLSVDELINLRHARIPGPVAAVGAVLAGGQQIDRRILGPQLRAPIAAGQVTGEGWAAGMMQRARAFGLNIANPFDMITGQVANQIVQGIAGAGISGELADVVAQGVADVINDLGIAPEQAVKMATFAVREANMSMEEFTNQMSDLDDIAKDTGQTITNVADNLDRLQREAVTRGGAGAAAPTAEAFAATARVLSRPGDEAQTRLQTWRAAAQTRLAARAGFTSYDAFTREAIIGGNQALVNEAQAILAAFPDMPLDWIARRVYGTLAQAGGPYEGLNVEDIIHLWRQLGFDDQGRFDPNRAGAYQDVMASETAAGALERAMAKAPLEEGRYIIGYKGGRTWAGVDRAAQEAEYVTALEQELLALNIPSARVGEILGPLRQQVGYTGDSQESEEEDRRLFELARSSVEEQVTRVVIDLTPDAKKYFRSPSGSMSWEQFIQGRGRAQDSYRPPGG